MTCTILAIFDILTVGFYRQITDYQTVMEQEKEALESELMQKQALFHEEKALMTQLLTEAEQKQEQQNQETMYVDRLPFCFFVK